jgi:tRNA(fMet)-specific endonuclease VapC
MTAAELYYGAEKSADPHHNRQLVAKLLGTLPLLRPGGTAARRFGVLKATLEGMGQRLADADLIIASICLAHDAVLVTGNLGHYTRIPGLLTEDWIRGD